MRLASNACHDHYTMYLGLDDRSTTILPALEHSISSPNDNALSSVLNNKSHTRSTGKDKTRLAGPVYLQVLDDKSTIPEYGQPDTRQAMARVIPSNTFSGIFPAIPELRQQDPYVMSGRRGSGISAIPPQPTTADFIGDRRAKPTPLPPTQKAAKAAGLKGKLQRIKRALFHTKSTSKPRPQSTFRTPSEMAPRSTPVVKPTAPPNPAKPTKRSPHHPQRHPSKSGTIMTSRSHGAPIPISRVSFVAPGRNLGLFPGSIEKPAVSIMTTSPSGRRMTIHVPEPSTSSTPPRVPPKERKTATLRHPVVSGLVPDLPTPGSFGSTSTGSSAKSLGRRSSVGTDDDTRSALNFEGKVENPVDPRKIFRESRRYTQLTEVGSGLTNFLHQFDGAARFHTASFVPDRSAETLARPGTADSEVQRKQNRNAALAALGGASLHSDGAEANAKWESIAAWRRQHPESLLPGRVLAQRTPSVRERDEISKRRKSSAGGLYIAYTAPLDPFGEEPAAVRPARAFSQDWSFSSISRSSTPSSFADMPSHRRHYSAVESVHSEASLDLPIQSNRTPSPDAAQHRDLYNRVESGVFDDDWRRNIRSMHADIEYATPSATATPSYFSRDTPRNSAPIPPPKPPTPPKQVVGVRRKPVGTSAAPAKSTAHLSAYLSDSTPTTFPTNKPLPTHNPIPSRKKQPSRYRTIRPTAPPVRPEADKNKTLPFPPAPSDPKRYTNGIVPSISNIRMNSVRFPIVKKKAERGEFCAEPEYKRRSVNEVEAKFRRDEERKGRPGRMGRK
ncbi:hypothetical protein LTR78_009810 [Recurvomyces mirabilis]|uniref:Uncharacterized protein n=1 Tax=Recurvomyces mirabilis TaxID=574656 RepID=A0AAE0WFA2_9PEZI|nr:hypothetical protein LTR78_009810 [Recurvomyces mirabilis]KAK5158227.1 hypothetical protein LTS14_003245 [Recurvomyces mirabilis]